MIKEIIMLRGIACLSIVFLHAIGIGLARTPELQIGALTATLLDSIHLLLYFGTPLFIFISEFLLAYAYRHREIPKQFIFKRLKYIFLPFAAMAFFYSIPYASSFESWGKKFFLNIAIGDFHGYFVLIIFQFYLIHIIFCKSLQKWNPTIVISIAGVVNICYLALFHVTSPPSIMYGEYIWERFYWIPMFGWIFYFTVGYYCGLYYETFFSLLKKYKYVVFSLPLISSLLLLSMYHSNILIVHSSKRIDLILHTIAVAFLLFYLARYIHSHLLQKVSQYSFGIYLLHMFYILLIDKVYELVPMPIGSYYILFLFLFSTASSMVTIYYANKWRYGKYIVGKINISQATESDRKSRQQVSYLQAKNM